MVKELLNSFSFLLNFIFFDNHTATVFKICVKINVPIKSIEKKAAAVHEGTHI